MDIFKSYPKADMFYKVGNYYFAKSGKSHAEAYARQQGLPVTELVNPAIVKEETKKESKQKAEK